MLNPRQPTHQQCARVGVKEDATRLDSPITFCCLLHWRRRGVGFRNSFQVEPMKLTPVAMTRQKLGHATCERMPYTSIRPG